MKSLFDPGNYPAKIDMLLLIVRLAAAAFMLTHGLGKFSKLVAPGPVEFSDPLGIGTTMSLFLTVFAEVFCSALLILGLATRLATIPLIITMLVTVLIVHLEAGFGKQELPLLYFIIYLVLLIAGPGKYSMDNWIYKKLA